MPDRTLSLTLFPLTIALSEDGNIWWTHFYGNLGHTRTLEELPAYLQPSACATVEQLEAAAVSRLTILPDRFPVCLINTRLTSLPALVVDIHETLHLLSWWMEWSRRRSIADGRHWLCPECHAEVPPEIGHCAKVTCGSWHALALITGQPILQIVDEKKGGC